MLCAVEVHGQSRGMLQVTGGQSLNILGICIPHNSHLFHVVFREREKYTVELRDYLASADHFSLSLSLSLLLSWDVWPLSELANFVFTNHSVGCREKEKKKEKIKKK